MDYLSTQTHQYNVSTTEPSGHRADLRTPLLILLSYTTMNPLPKQQRLQLALEAYKKGLFLSITKAALAYDVPPSTLKDRIKGVAPREEKTANCRKLTDTEEDTLSAWILDMEKRGLPLQMSAIRHLVQRLLSARIPSSSKPIGEKWVARYIKRRPELKAKFSQTHDYERAKCEGPNLIKGWFQRFNDAVEKYGILSEDIYNMDEAGFQIGIISTAKVVCGSDIRRNIDTKAVQPGKEEWATAVVAINATGWALPPQIILAAESRQSRWHHDIPSNYTISISKDGWTNDELGFEWLQKVFEPATASRTVGRYRLLILDGHSGYATASFDKFCTERMIIPLYLPPHSSHLLQPLDVGCFGPTKNLYGQKVQELMQQGIQSITKEDFLYLYPTFHQHTLSASNIKRGFKATGLVPLSPERVSKPYLQLKTPTPPFTANTNSESFNIRETPANVYEPGKRKKQVQHLQSYRPISLATVDQTVSKIIKGAEMVMRNAILLQEELHRLRAESARQKQQQQQRPGHFIQNGDSLLDAEGLSRAQEEEIRQLPLLRSRRPPTCSDCHQIGHNRLQCHKKRSI